jgi:hypothetical protein
MDAFNEAVYLATIAELRRQNEALLAANEKLQKELNAWPMRALDNALKAREDEKKKKENQK